MDQIDFDKFVDQNESEDWTSIKYYAGLVMKEEQLKNFDVELKINDQKRLKGKVYLQEAHEVPIILKTKAETDLINKQIFHFIQLI